MEQHKEQNSSFAYNQVDEPKLYDVIILNDDSTTMDFVVDILKRVFYYEATLATTIMLTIHRKGFCVVGTYNLDIAQSKQKKATDLAQSLGFPLRVKIQPHQ
jgi:ATP-dependent Clp protease adaptor protein ClpS